MKVICFDTETTGLDPKNDNIIEIALYTVEDGECTEEYNRFIYYGEDHKLSEKIIDLTGITDKMLSDGGVLPSVVAADLVKRLTPGTLMIAHNTQFDLSFIYELIRKYYPDKADTIVSECIWLDTLTIFKDRKSYPHKLIDMVEHYELEDVEFHRAINDTYALYQSVLALRKERNDLREYINVFGYNPKYGVTGERFSFITYGPQRYHNNKSLVSSEKILPKIIKEKEMEE